MQLTIVEWHLGPDGSPFLHTVHGDLMCGHVSPSSTAYTAVDDLIERGGCPEWLRLCAKHSVGDGSTLRDVGPNLRAIIISAAPGNPEVTLSRLVELINREGLPMKAPVIRTVEVPVFQLITA